MFGVCAHPHELFEEEMVTCADEIDDHVQRVAVDAALLGGEELFFELISRSEEGTAAPR